MNRSEQHPDSILLDQLRAGLLDGDPRQKSELEQHLQHCERCRRAYDWPGNLGSAMPELDSRPSCVEAWPPVLAAEDAEPVGEWDPSDLCEDDLILARILRLDGLDPAGECRLADMAQFGGAGKGAGIDHREDVVDRKSVV